MLSVKIRKLTEESKVPEHAHKGDAGMDIFASEKVILRSGKHIVIPTGIAMEIPEGYAGLVWDKSGLAISHGLTIIAGVIDAGYRGEIFVAMTNISDKAYTLEKGDKVAQILIQKIESPIILQVDELTDSSRGEGGFGSTGK